MNNAIPLSLSLPFKVPIFYHLLQPGLSRQLIIHNLQEPKRVVVHTPASSVCTIAQYLALEGSIVRLANRNDPSACRAFTAQAAGERLIVTAM